VIEFSPLAAWRDVALGVRGGVRGQFACLVLAAKMGERDALRKGATMLVWVVTVRKAVGK
jgi:hypothetical protein